MEIHILLFGILIPLIVGISVSVWQGIRERAPGNDVYFGFAMSCVLLFSAISQDTLDQFTTQKKWLWFPCSVACVGLFQVAGIFFPRSTCWRVMLGGVASFSAALALDVPEWTTTTSRVLLGLVTAMYALNLSAAARMTWGFPTPLALGIAVLAPAVLAFTSGFIKLAVPIAAVSFCLAMVSLVCLATKKRTPNRDCVGFAGAVVVACVSSLGSATGFGYDTSGIPTTAWALAGFAPLGILVGRLPIFHSRPKSSAMAQLIGCAILASASIVCSVLS